MFQIAIISLIMLILFEIEMGEKELWRAEIEIGRRN